MELLNKGLKYNLQKKQKGWICNLAMEAETAIMMLLPGEQDYVRHQVAKNLKKIYQQQGQRSTHIRVKEKEEDKTVKRIKDKLKDNNAIIQKADKGNSIVVIYTDEYTQKVHKDL